MHFPCTAFSVHGLFSLVFKFSSLLTKNRKRKEQSFISQENQQKRTIPVNHEARETFPVTKKSHYKINVKQEDKMATSIGILTIWSFRTLSLVPFSFTISSPWKTIPSFWCFFLLKAFLLTFLPSSLWYSSWKPRSLQPSSLSIFSFTTGCEVNAL